MAQDFAKRFYNSAAWLKCRDGYMQSQHYVCERCGGLAEICHHQTYLTAENIDDPTVSLSWEQLEALCHDCHNLEHNGGNRQVTQDNLFFDENGNLILKNKK